MGDLFHLHNGDAARAVLERSDLPGRHGVWAEALHEGPVRGLLPRDTWRRERVDHYRSLGRIQPGLPDPAVLLARWDRDLEAAGSCAEGVIWLEHDLFDQLLLIHHLAHFARAPRPAGRLSLVCIGEHPEVPDFVGLGQLRPEAMAALFEERQPLGEEVLALGRRAWQAFCAPEPTALWALLDEDLRALPFLAAALRRFCQEYPGADGLSRSERQALRALADGPRGAGALFGAGQGAEESPFLGDLLFYATLDRLAKPPHPLLALATPGPAWRDREVSLTKDGQRVLAGDADAVALRGLDIWRGGVHLRGAGSPWRYRDGDGFRRAGAGG